MTHTHHPRVMLYYGEFVERGVAVKAAGRSIKPSYVPSGPRVFMRQDVRSPPLALWF